eukprot:TRINITY_DN2950_c0_g1_i1.p1 TRINITY_DN2950_c0_g1~~TRINITY_DN2950_c0_g1_i1.p1  ORF type:complete len:189 (+),score=51.31 TRINITY_DN2950_c0_g1_i1:50-616(+)
MSQVNFHPQVKESLEALRDPNGSIKWMTLSYSSEEKDSLVLSGQGAGSVEEFLMSLSDDQVGYGLISLKVDDAFSNRFKNALIVWSGEKSHWMIRGQVTAHKPQIESYFKGAYHVMIPATSKDELSEDLIRKAVKKASGADYDAGGKDQTTAEMSATGETEGEGAAKAQFSKPERPGRGGRQLIRKKE